MGVAINRRGRIYLTQNFGVVDGQKDRRDTSTPLFWFAVGIVLAVIIVALIAKGWMEDEEILGAEERNSIDSANLSFVATATPYNYLADVKATVAAAGLLGKVSKGKAINASFYELLVECGGPISVRDDLINAAVPQESLVYQDGEYFLLKERRLHPIQLILSLGWEKETTIDWSVQAATVTGMWDHMESGTLKAGCLVDLD